MSGPRRYHYHPQMAEPCEVPDPGRPLWREIADGAVELGVFLLVALMILGAIVVAGTMGLRHG